MAKIYGEVAGKVLEIQNWRDRASGDAVVMQRLSDHDAATFRTLRADGLSDTQIFQALHPEAVVEGATVREIKLAPQPTPRSPVADSLQFRFDELPKEQLVWVIEQVMGQRAESLANMDHPDLLNLARFATKGKKIELSFIP